MKISTLVTSIRIIALPFVIILFSIPEYRLLATILFAFTMATDVIDGKVARHFNEQSNTGIFLDPMFDKIVVDTMIVFMAYLNLLPLWMVLLMLAREFAVQGFRSIAPVKGVVLKTGLISKSKLQFQFGAIVFAMLDSVFGGLSLVAWIFMAITLLTGYVSMIKLIYEHPQVITKEELDIKAID